MTLWRTHTLHLPGHVPQTRRPYFSPDIPAPLSLACGVVRKRPLILVSPSVETKAREFEDMSLSLSQRYERALLGVDLLPWPVLSLNSATKSPRASSGRMACCSLVARMCIPSSTIKNAPTPAQKCILTRTAARGICAELMLVDEVFRQRKPLLAICRGHQILNVALGGTLFADIPTQLPAALNHRRMDQRSAKVHDVHLTPGGLLAKITRKRVLGVNSTTIKPWRAWRRFSPWRGAVPMAWWRACS